MSDTEFDVGTEDFAGDDELDYEEGEEYEAEEFEEAEDDDDPYAWIKEAGEDNVKKTWTQYTQTREEALQEKREAERLRAELEPIAKLKEEIMADPGLVAAIQDYMTSGDRPAEREVAEIKQQLTGMQQQIMTEKELNELHRWAEEKGYPDFSDQELLQHAVANRIGNLRAAYSDMNIDAIQNAKADKVVSGIKRSKGAKTLKTKGEASRKSKFTEADIATMSKEDFIKNYDAIMEVYAGIE